MSTDPMQGGKAIVGDQVFKPGYVLDKKYRLEKRLGLGGMAHVFEATDLSANKKCAIKILKEVAAENETSAKRFQKEGLITRSLSHRNIIKVTDAGIDEKNHRYLVMELLKGESLEERLTHAERDENFIRELISILIDVCDGLQAAHDKNIIHRDLKPSNIFLHMEESDQKTAVVPKIVDFGIAKRLDSDDTKLTMTGDICGTTEYIAPERILGSEPDAGSDIYSLGVILYYGLTGKSPLKVKTAESSKMLFRRAVDPIFKIESLRSVNPLISRRLERICFKAMSRDPMQRHDSAFSLGKDLGECLKQKRRSCPWFVAISVFAAAALLMSILRPGSDERIQKELKTERKPDQRALTVQLRDISDAPITTPQKTDTLPVIHEKKTKKTNEQVKNEATEHIDTQPFSLQEEKQKTAAEKLIEQADEELSARNYENAESLYSQAIGLNKSLAGAWFGKGKSEFKLGKFNAAIDSMIAALRLRPRDSKWRNYLGKVYMANGDRTRAVEQWNQVLRDDPDDKEAKSHLEEAGAAD